MAFKKTFFYFFLTLFWHTTVQAGTEEVSSHGKFYPDYSAVAILFVIKLVKCEP